MSGNDINFWLNNFRIRKKSMKNLNKITLKLKVKSKSFNKKVRNSVFTVHYHAVKVLYL